MDVFFVGTGSGDQKVAELVYKTKPLLALVRKDENFGGKYLPIPVNSATSQART